MWICVPLYYRAISLAATKEDPSSTNEAVIAEDVASLTSLRPRAESVSEFVPEQHKSSANVSVRGPGLDVNGSSSMQQKKQKLLHHTDTRDTSRAGHTDSVSGFTSRPVADLKGSTNTQQLFRQSVNNSSKDVV